MIELFDKEEAMRIGMFVVSSVIGMLFAYYRKWSFEIPEGTGLFQYIFGDPHAIGRALTTLMAMCAGAGGLSYLDSLTASQILIAGASIGLLVPQTVANKIGGTPEFEPAATLPKEIADSGDAQKKTTDDTKPPKPAQINAKKSD